MGSFAVLAALCSSACSASASALQHRAAMLVRAAGGRAVRATLTHRLWLIAVVLQACGFLLHATALDLGQLVIVQPLLVCVVLFALPLNRVLRREPITVREVGWAALLVAGLAGFLVTASPNVVVGPEHAAAVPAVVAASIGASAVGALILVATRPWCAPEWRARLLGAAAGILFATQAALLKSTVGLLGKGIGALATNWQPYVLIVVGLGGIACSQVAFRAAPLATSLPVVNTVNPLLGIVAGAVIYHENVHYSGLPLLVEAVCLGSLIAATLSLSRLEHAS
ncbi:MAG TPA: DMT family transporter [Pseudonocardiaceae bacterium]|nr:DMT family transporter [Pseudonocardiaceae bacterium]